MPSVTKQKPPSKAAPSANGFAAPDQPQAPAGSMLARGLPVGQLDTTEFLSILMYGVNRVGKTTTACQFPKPLALVSFEPTPFTGGAASVTKIAGVDHFMVVPSTALAKWPKGKQQPIPGIAGALALAQEMAQGCKYKSVVLDGGTSLQDVALAELMNLPELPAQMRVARSKDDQTYGVATSEQYMDRSSQAKEVLRRFIGLQMNKIILCKERDHNPPKDDRGHIRRDKLTRGLTLESFIAADLGQATAGWLMDACDCVCRLYVAQETKEEEYQMPGGEKVVQTIETGKMTRRLLLQLHTNFAAGIRSASPDKVPEFVEGSSPKKLYDELIKVLRA